MTSFLKIIGITLLLILVIGITATFRWDAFTSAFNLGNVTTRIALFGILGIGVSFVIITGGIDLSIGSLVGLVGALLPILLVEKEVWTPLAIMAVLGLSLGIGLLHGLLITKLNLQPFVVTLCGLLVYRSAARWIAEDSMKGFGAGFRELRHYATGSIQIYGEYGIPYPLFIMLSLAVVAAVFLNKTIYGRYLLALGRNEQAARYSGINTDRMKILAYMICSGVAGLGGVLFSLYFNSVQPASHGSFYELYAIAAAVLGGCSLRGGEGSILGVVIGAALMQFLYNANSLLGGSDPLEPGMIGVAILLAVVADEFLKRVIEVRRRAADARRLVAPATEEKSET